MILKKTPLTLAAIAALLFSPLGLADDLHIHGLNETIRFSEVGDAMPAKLDTGAVTASMHAENIKVFKRDEKRWVRFQLPIDGKLKEMELPMIGVSSIKRRLADIPEDETELYTQRPLVEMTLCMGNQAHTIEVNLTDRSHFSYPVLIGSDALKRFNAMVDPARTYFVGQPSCA